MERYIYANSYQLFVEYVLRERRVDFGVITHNNNLERFCRDCSIEVIKINRYSDTAFVLRKSAVLESVNSLIAKIGGRDVLFSHLNFDVYGFVFFSLAIQKGVKLYFCPIEKVYSRTIFIPWHKRYLYLQSFSSFLNFSYNLKTFVTRFNKTMTISIGSEDLIKNGVEKYNLPDSINNLFVHDRFRPDTTQVDILFLLDEYAKISVEEQYSIASRLAELFRVGIKPHPNTRLKKFPSDLKVFSHYNPTEFLLPNVKIAVIGNASIGLRFAAQMTDLSIISLLDFSAHEADSSTITLKNYISDGVYMNFPKSFSDIEKILRKSSV